MSDRPEQPDNIGQNEETDESSELNDETRRLLDQLDDDLDENQASGDKSTAALLQNLDRMKPQTVQKADTDETSAEAAASEEESSDAKTAVPPVTYQYRITARLTETVKNAVQEVCEALELEPTGAGLLQMHPVFRTEDSNKIASILDTWVQEHLPLKTRFSSVYSEVVGAQIYRAGWKLDNIETLQAAHDVLQNVLVDEVRTEPAMKEYFRPVLFILSSIPAVSLPRLVAHLQTHFEPLEWTIEGVELSRAPVVEQEDEAEDTESQTDKVEWHIMGEFRTDSDTSIEENQE